jgi:hypothetical protein
MFNPLHITSHNILSTKLTPLPIISSLQPAHSLPHMLIDLINTKDQATLATLLVVGTVNAVFEQVVDDFA